MPVVLRIYGYRFWFYDADLDEPPRVHVGNSGREAKYWIDLFEWQERGAFAIVN